MAKPIYVKVEKNIHQPLDKVWETVALGFGHVSAYNPEIKSSRFDSDQKSGIGTRRYCEFLKGGFIKEEIIEWNEPDSFKLKFIETSAPMGFLECKFSFVASGDSTRVVQEFWYRMKAPLGWLSGLMKQKMQSTLENGLNGLEQYIKQK